MSVETERLNIAVRTPAGEITSVVEIPTGFVPLTAIVPVLRRLGEETQTLEERRTAASGHQISCRKGCAACCRMLVPVSPPEAFTLSAFVAGLPADRRQAIEVRLAETKQGLVRAGLWERLQDVSETEAQLQDADMDAINHDYYALRLPCPFLEDELCSIYEQRPAACRELLVTSPAEYCQDMEANPVRPLPVPVRMGTVLSVLWKDLVGGPARLIPLPLAVPWAARHATIGTQTWKGTALLERALDRVWQFLIEAFAAGERTQP